MEAIEHVEILHPRQSHNLNTHHPHPFTTFGVVDIVSL